MQRIPLSTLLSDAKGEGVNPLGRLLTDSNMKARHLGFFLFLFFIFIFLLSNLLAFR